MTAVRRKLACVSIVAAMAAGLPFLGAAQDPFPDGQARDTIFLVCTQCHPITRITDGELSAADWEFTLYDMIARGAPVHADDVEAVRDYLIENFSRNEP